MGGWRGWGGRGGRGDAEAVLANDLNCGVCGWKRGHFTRLDRAQWPGFVLAQLLSVLRHATSFFFLRRTRNWVSYFIHDNLVGTPKCNSPEKTSLQLFPFIAHLTVDWLAHFFLFPKGKDSWRAPCFRAPRMHSRGPLKTYPNEPGPWNASMVSPHGTVLSSWLNGFWNKCFSVFCCYCCRFFGGLGGGGSVF